MKALGLRYQTSFSKHSSILAPLAPGPELCGIHLSPFTKSGDVKHRNQSQWDKHWDISVDVTSTNSVNGFDRGEIVQEITILAINGESCKWSLNKSGRGIGNLKPSGMMRPLHSTLRHWEWVNSSSPDDSRLFSASANYTPPIFASTNPVFPSSSFAAPSSSPRFPRSETGTKTRKLTKGIGMIT